MVSCRKQTITKDKLVFWLAGCTKPIIPKNKLFEEEDAVKFWLTDDNRKIPLKLEAKMNFGSFVIEVSDYSNVK